MILNKYGKILETYSYRYDKDEEADTTTLSEDYFRYNLDIDDIDGAVRTRIVRRNEMSNEVVERKKIYYVKGNDVLEVVNSDDNLEDTLMGITVNGMVTLPDYPLETQYVRCVTLYNYENAESKDEESGTYSIKISFKDKEITTIVDRKLSAIVTEYVDYTLFRSYLSTDNPTDPDTKFYDVIYMTSDFYSSIAEDPYNSIEVVSLNKDDLYSVKKIVNYHTMDHEFDLLRRIPDTIQIDDFDTAETVNEVFQENSSEQLLADTATEENGIVYITYDEKAPFMVNSMRYNGSDVIMQKMVSKSLEHNNTYYWYESIYPLYFCNNFKLNKYPKAHLWAYDWAIFTNDDITTFQRMIYLVEDPEALIEGIKAGEDPLKDRYKNGYTRSE